MKTSSALGQQQSWSKQRCPVFTDGKKQLKGLRQAVVWNVSGVVVLAKTQSLVQACFSNLVLKGLDLSNLCIVSLSNLHISRSSSS